MTRSTTSLPARRSSSPLLVSRCRTARPGPGHPLDQPSLDQPAGERPERLVALEGQLGQVVQRRVRLPAEMAQRVPLDQRDADLGQCLVQRPVMAVL